MKEDLKVGMHGIGNVDLPNVVTHLMSFIPYYLTKSCRIVISHIYHQLETSIYNTFQLSNVS